jgi:pimeloyl-ACP methyl ester carboxylesterase
VVVVGKQDLLTPPWQAKKKVADAISGARYELVTDTGSSHGLHLDRPEDLGRIVTDFLRHHELEPTPVNS